MVDGKQIVTYHPLFELEYNNWTCPGRLCIELVNAPPHFDSDYLSVTGRDLYSDIAAFLRTRVPFDTTTCKVYHCPVFVLRPPDESPNALAAFEQALNVHFKPAFDACPSRPLPQQ
jgi:hypothetical protein